MADKAAKKAEDKEETKNLRVWYQFAIGIIVVLGGFMIGTAVGWSSPAIELLNENGITEDVQIAWIAGIFAIGSSISQFAILGFIAYLGLKWAIVVSHIIVIFGWIGITLTYNYYCIIICRIVLGMAGGFAVASAMYIAETTHKRYRGTIAVLFQVFVTLGILFAFVFGVFGNMYILNAACVSGSVFGLILSVLFLPESPYALMKKGKTEQFAEVMRKFRGNDYDYSSEEAEIKAAIENKESWKEGMKDPLNLRAFTVLLTLHVIQQFSGINGILCHTVTIFKMSKTNIDSNLSAVLFGIAQVVFCVIAALTVDRLGRIILYIISLLIMVVSLTATGVFFLIDDEWKQTMSTLPTISLVIYICGFSMGTGPLPWAMLGEYLPNDCKTLMSAIIAATNYFLVFLVAYIMPICLNAFNPAYLFFSFAIVSVLGIVFVLFFVVETKQKSLEQIRNDIENFKIGDYLRKKVT